MARSVLKVDVDDAAFKRFEEAFKRYEAARVKLGKQPLLTPKEIRNSEQDIKRQTALLSLRNKTAAGVSAASAAIAARAARSWDVISTRSGQAARNVAEMTTRMLRWASLGAAGGALLGTGGALWGLDRLSMSAGAGRRSATGLGVSYGEQQAFGLTFGRLVDAGSFMGGISQAKGNIASGATAALLSLGIDPNSGGDLAGRTLDRVRQLAQQTPEHLLGVLPQSHNLGELGLDVETLRRLKNTPASEYLQHRNDYIKRRGQLEVGDPALKAAQDLAVQLDVAGERIKSGLIKGFSELMPHLTRASEGLGDVAEKLLGSKGAKEAVTWLSNGLKQFGDYVQDEGFKRDVKEFVGGIKSMSSAIAKGLRMLGILADPAAGQGAAAPTIMSFEEWERKRQAEAAGQPATVRQRYLERNRESYQDYLRQMGATPGVNVSGAWGPSPFGPGISITDPKMKAYAEAIAGIESRGGPNGGYGSLGPVTSWGDRAYGKYQVMGNNIGSWSKEALGRVLTPEDFLKSPEAQDAIFQHRFKKYIEKYGTPQDAASAWHSGRPLSQAGSAQDQLGTRTTDYVKKFNSAVRVTIENNTGGNVVTQTNQIAY